MESIELDTEFIKNKLINYIRENKIDDLKKLLQSSEPSVLSQINHADLFYEAIYQNNPEIVDHLLLYGCDPNAKNDYGLTPLHFVARYKPPANQQDRQKNKFLIYSALLARKADVNQITKNENTPLHLVAMNNERWSICLANILLYYNADYNARNFFNSTPLHIACAKNNKLLAALLLKHKAFVNLQDRDGRTPLHTVIMQKSNDILPILLEYGALINKKDNQGFTPLHLAAHHENSDGVKFLIKHGACINSISDGAELPFGNTPLHEAASVGNVPIISLLLKAGAEINKQNYYGCTPLILAAYYEISEKNRCDSFLKLSQHGADPSIKTTLGDSFMDYVADISSKKVFLTAFYIVMRHEYKTVMPSLSNVIEYLRNNENLLSQFPQEEIQLLLCSPEKLYEEMMTNVIQYHSYLPSQNDLIKREMGIKISLKMPTLLLEKNEYLKELKKKEE